MTVDGGDLIAGRYRLRERLGRGGMSVVWRADDEVLGREVAVKVLSSALASDPELRRRIRDEARTAARLRHPAVVAVYDYGEFTDCGRALSYVVMELVDGRTLADMLTGGSLPWKVAVLVGAQVAAALASAHTAGVVHRDVKPANVMVTGVGVKLVDFGISAAVGAVDERQGHVLGTPAYLAPERVRGGPVRPATDVYALGLMLYLALCGRMPWDASTVTQMVRAHVYVRPAALPVISGLPPQVAQLVSRCLAKQPADRPSAVEVAESLGEIAGLPSARVMRSASVAPTLALPKAGVRRGRRALFAAAGTAAVMITAGGAWWGLLKPADATAATPPGHRCPATATCTNPAEPPGGMPSGTTTPSTSTPVPPTVVGATTVVDHREKVSHRAPAKKPTGHKAVAVPDSEPGPVRGPKPRAPKPHHPPPHHK
jgi:eukaryotic-like serine/threonine-protein kinase